MSNQSKVHVFGRWEETRVPGEIPALTEENTEAHPELNPQPPCNEAIALLKKIDHLKRLDIVNYQSELKSRCKKCNDFLNLKLPKIIIEFVFSGVRVQNKFFFFF